MRLLAGSKNMTGFGEPEAGPLWLWLLPPPLKYIDDWDEVGGWPGGGPWWCNGGGGCLNKNGVSGNDCCC
jgi:hypothetical protein